MLESDSKEKRDNIARVVQFKLVPTSLPQIRERYPTPRPKLIDVIKCYIDISSRTYCMPGVSLFKSPIFRSDFPLLPSELHLH